MEEGRAELDSSQKIYDTLIEHFHEELAKAQQATQEELREVDERFSAQVETNGHDGHDDESTQKTVQEREEVKRAISKRGEEIADKIKKAAASVRITQMRFARRALVSRSPSVMAGTGIDNTFAGRQTSTPGIHQGEEVSESDLASGRCIR